MNNFCICMIQQMSLTDILVVDVLNQRKFEMSPVILLEHSNGSDNETLTNIKRNATLIFCNDNFKTTFFKDLSNNFSTTTSRQKQWYFERLNTSY